MEYIKSNWAQAHCGLKSGNKKWQLCPCHKDIVRAVLFGPYLLIFFQKAALITILVIDDNCRKKLPGTLQQATGALEVAPGFILL